MFHDKIDIAKRQRIPIIENGFYAVKADGKCGLLFKNKLFTGLVFDRIKKISYRHYLCFSHNNISIYRYNNIGYETVYSGEFFQKKQTIESDKPLSFSQFLKVLEEKYPEERNEISKLIKQDNDDRYISEFNYFSCYIDDIDLEWAIQRAIIDKNFNAADFDIQYAPVAMG